MYRFVYLDLLSLVTAAVTVSKTEILGLRSSVSCLMITYEGVARNQTKRFKCNR